MINDSSGNNYFNARNVLADIVGDWFNIGGYDTVTGSLELAVGAGNVTGQLYADFTVDPTFQKGVSRVAIPQGCLHTNLAGVSMANPAQRIDVAAATSGAFTFSFSTPALGKMRWTWHFLSGTGGGANTLTMFLDGRHPT